MKRKDVVQLENNFLAAKRRKKTQQHKKTATQQQQQDHLKMFPSSPLFSSFVTQPPSSCLCVILQRILFVKL
jgi:hypothetical protein